MDSSTSGGASEVSPVHPDDAPPKRTRVLLSCAPCRASKLKCDRATPCGQCLKKGRTEGCLYAPRPEKQKPAKSMAARLKRLEGMVREMLDTESPDHQQQQQLAAEADEFILSRGKVVQVEGGDRGTTYVGATHFMAMLDDIEDLKSYFDERDEPEEGGSLDDSPEADAPDLLLLSRSVPKTKQELLTFLPPKSVADRLVMRYFGSHSPSQHIVHRPTFVKQYNEFWHNPLGVPMDWLALLFMVLGLGVFFSSFSAPHELANDSPAAPWDRFKTLRTAAGWALISSKYATPGRNTLAPMVLYIEAEFVSNRASQTSCYLLISVCIRMMLKMGLHRDPSKLVGISAFDGEMRRRMWNMAIQIDLMVAFHMGLPSMIHGIESDTTYPRNLLDEDFDENSEELPPGRPASEYTSMSYPIFKSTICRVFGLVARQAHSLTLPAYADVMKLDNLLEEKWKAVPQFLKVKSLDDSVTDPPFQVVQRFGIASLYQKSRCVLHRRYLIGTPPRKEHEYSRKTCLSAALSLLEYQKDIYDATQPGKMLSANGWFTTSLAMHDFLLAAMIVYLVIQHQHYSEGGENYDWLTRDTLLPSKLELIDILKRSKAIWAAIAVEAPEVKKAPEVLDTMLKKIQFRCEAVRRPCTARSVPETTPQNVEENNGTNRDADTDAALSTRMEIAPLQNLRIEGPVFPDPNLTTDPQDAPMPFSRSDLMPNSTAMTGVETSTWIPETPADVDWNSLEDALRTNVSLDPALSEQWVNTGSFSQMDFVAENFWNPPQDRLGDGSSNGL